MKEEQVDAHNSQGNEGKDYSEKFRRNVSKNMVSGSSCGIQMTSVTLQPNIQKVDHDLGGSISEVLHAQL